MSDGLELAGGSQVTKMMQISSRGCEISAVSTIKWQYIIINFMINSLAAKMNVNINYDYCTHQIEVSTTNTVA